LSQLAEYEIPEIDCVIVDLYPFEETVASTNSETDIIEKIDIGGISLIRAAAKNFNDIAVVPSREEYEMFLEMITEKKGILEKEDRKELARRAFKVSSNYDIAIFNYFNEGSTDTTFKYSIHRSDILRYGENPHQQGVFYGNIQMPVALLVVRLCWRHGKQRWLAIRLPLSVGFLSVTNPLIWQQLKKSMDFFMKF